MDKEEDSKNNLNCQTDISSKMWSLNIRLKHMKKIC